MRTVVSLLALASCTHHRPLTAVHEVAGKPVVADFANGGQTEVQVLMSPPGAPPGVQFRDAAGGMISPQLTVTRVTDTNRAEGALEGLGLGILLGAGVGAVAGYSSGDDDPDQFLSFSAGDKAVLLGVFLGATGGLIGVIAGAVHGDRTIYSNDQTSVTLGGSHGAAFTVRF